jgi:hypothetical protein
MHGETSEFTFLGYRRGIYFTRYLPASAILLSEIAPGFAVDLRTKCDDHDEDDDDEEDKSGEERSDAEDNAVNIQSESKDAGACQKEGQGASTPQQGAG